MPTLKFNAPNGVLKIAGTNPVKPIIPDASAPLDILIKLTEVLRLTASGKTFIYDQMKKDRFPKSIRLGNRSVVWLLSDVQKYIADRVAESRGNA